MDDNGCKIMELLFFGAGKKGRYWLEYGRGFGIEPKGIIDNDRTLCGSLCENIRIYHPDNLNELSFEYIFITCNREQEIYQQLLELGVEKSKIISGAHGIANHFLFGLVQNVIAPNNVIKQDDAPSIKKVLFDLQHGMVLGGVEAWVYSQAKVLKERGLQGLYLAADEAGPAVADTTFPVQMLRCRELGKEKDKILLCLEKIAENLPCTIVCNFPQSIFWAACIAKRLYPKQVRMIAVQHSDEQIYYETYSLWQGYIDKCLVISSRMERKLILSGMREDRIWRLQWKVPCGETLDRTWSGDGASLQIGYAGRITAAQKRADLLPELAMKLRNRGVRFQMNIAGAGDYSETLKQRIEEAGLQDCMALVGCIDRKEISFFWKRQDVMAGCSDVEGHSITQSEAMASGAVPVITDVSGAEDDVTDGYNGYIVDVGDVEALADRMCRLYHDRGLLARMGRNACRTIGRRQAQMDQAAFWDGLLGEAWRK